MEPFPARDPLAVSALGTNFASRVEHRPHTAAQAANQHHVAAAHYDQLAQMQQSERDSLVSTGSPCLAATALTDKEVAGALALPGGLPNMSAFMNSPRTGEEQQQIQAWWLQSTRQSSCGQKKRRAFCHCRRVNPRMIWPQST